MRMQSRKGRGRGRGRGEGQGRAKATGRAERRRKVAPRSGSGLEQGISGRRQYGVGQRCRRYLPSSYLLRPLQLVRQKNAPHHAASLRLASPCAFSKKKTAGAGERKAEQTVQPTGLASGRPTREKHTQQGAAGHAKERYCWTRPLRSGTTEGGEAETRLWAPVWP